MQVNICDMCGAFCTGDLYNVMIYNHFQSPSLSFESLGNLEESTKLECSHEVCPRCYENNFKNIWREESEND